MIMKCVLAIVIICGDRSTQCFLSPVMHADTRQLASSSSPGGKRRRIRAAVHLIKLYIYIAKLADEEIKKIEARN